MTTPTTMFAELFRGRLDAYGTDTGGCVRATEPTYDYYLKRIRLHLDGVDPIGVYPLYKHEDSPANPWRVRWGCSDLDHTGDDPTDALNLAAMLRSVDLNAWVEVSKSKGHHVWSFASEWVPAETMRNAFLAAHQRLALKATEVNPKQVILADGKFGNYVRLPYPGTIASGGTPNRTQMVMPGDVIEGRMSLAAFVEAAHASRSPRAAYGAVAARYVPVRVRRVPLPIDVSEGLRSAPVSSEIRKAMSPYMFKIFDLSPPDFQDRSSRLMWLAHMAREEGFKPDETYAIVADADFRWGKFSIRADGEQRLSDIVMEAYAWSEV